MFLLSIILTLYSCIMFPSDLQSVQFIHGVLTYAAEGFACRDTAEGDANISEDALLCRLGCGYAALSGVLKCALHAAALAPSREQHQQDQQHEAPGASCAEGLMCVLSLLDLVLSLMSALTHGEVGTHSALRALVESRLSGRTTEPSTKAEKPAAAVACAVCVEAVFAPATPAPLPQLLVLTEHLRRREWADRCPTSVAVGVAALLGHLVHATLTHDETTSSMESLSSNKTADYKEAQGQTERTRTAVLEKLLEMYHAHGAIRNEMHILTSEEDHYRHYMKHRRRNNARYGALANHKSSRRPKRRKGYSRTRRNVRRALRNTGEDLENPDSDCELEESGMIESDDDCDGESQSETSECDDADGGAAAKYNAVPRGFRLDFLLRGGSSSRLRVTDGEGVENVSTTGFSLSSKQGRNVPYVVVIGSTAAQEGTGTESARQLPTPLEEAVLSLSSRLQGVFCRWDVHIEGTPEAAEVAESRRLSVAALHGDVRALLFGARSEILLAITACLPHKDGDDACNSPGR